MATIGDGVSGIIQAMEDEATKAGRYAADGARVGVTYELPDGRRGKAVVTAERDGAAVSEAGRRDLADFKRRARALGYTVDAFGTGAVKVTGARNST